MMVGGMESSKMLAVFPIATELPNAEMDRKSALLQDLARDI